MAPHSSTLAWKIPWMEEPGRLQSMGSRRVRHYWATSLSLFTFMHWRRKWQPTPVFLPGESQGWGSLMGCRLWGHTESDTLKQLSNSSSSIHLSPPSWIPSLLLPFVQGSKGDTNIKNRLLDSVGEGEGGMIWENSIETYTLPSPYWVALEPLLESNDHINMGQCLEFSILFYVIWISRKVL